MKKKTISYYKKKLDEVFSKYIRYRDKGQCFTCPHKAHPKKMQCGHFVPRQYLKTRYDEKNCHCQCMACNIYHGGQGPTYAVRLDEKYGLGTAKELEKGRWEVFKVDIQWYEEKIEHYKEKLKEVEY